eukprot:1153231-Pelagomonas_calceolata.AAC.8
MDSPRWICVPQKGMLRASGWALSLLDRALLGSRVKGPMVRSNFLEYTSVLALPLGLCGGGLSGHVTFP